MAASSDACSKAWYGWQLDRLRREAPTPDQTAPEEALRHLPLESLAEVIDATFKNYDTRATAFAERCLGEGNMDTFHAFIKAHHDILERFEVYAPNHYRDMARIIGFHFIRKVERKIGIEPTVVTGLGLRMPDSPLSGPPTPGSILSWVNNLDDSYSEPSPAREESMPISLVTTPGDDLSSIPDEHTEAPPSSANTHSPQRQRHPRKAKTVRVHQEPPKGLPSTRQKRAANGPARGQKAERKEPTPASTPEKETSQTGRGAKRQRAEDALIATKDLQVAQKRRKIAKPTTRSKG